MISQKYCVRCDTTRPVSEFNKGTSGDGLHTYCRECQQAYEREYWRKTKGRKKKWYAKRKEREYRNRKTILDYLMEHPCVDCGETNPLVLQFDHVRGEKKFNLGDAMIASISLHRIHSEIEKCEVRCVNCHLRKTAEENDYWILNYIE